MCLSGVARVGVEPVTMMNCFIIYKGVEPVTMMNCFIIYKGVEPVAMIHIYILGGMCWVY